MHKSTTMMDRDGLLYPRMHVGMLLGAAGRMLRPRLSHDGALRQPPQKMVDGLPGGSPA
jgi:hypothetical protein